MIGFIVSCFAYNNTGKGGHYYTAQTIFREIQKHRKATLIVIGDLLPTAVDLSIEGIQFLRVGRTIKRGDIRKFIEFIIENDIDVLHSFDTYAFLFCRQAAHFPNLRIVATKCGGPPPLFCYYPDICPDTVFSSEDQTYFERRARFFKIDTPALIPNRVGDLTEKVHGPDLKNLPAPANPDSIKIIRIARICNAYEKSIFQTIALAESLRSNGLDITVYIVGYIQDGTICERVQQALAPPDKLLTDDCYTHSASRHLHAVDIAVATGRGVMEASISDKIVMCSVSDSTHPYLLEASNATHFFKYNFSSRAPRPDISECANLEKLLNLLADRGQKKRHRRSMRAVNDRFFKVSAAGPSYLALYDRKRQARPPLVDALDRRMHRMVSIVKLGLRKLQHTWGRRVTTGFHT
jgi:hypothetical protein